METELELTARIGRLVIAAEKKDAAFDSLLRTFGLVVSGKIDASRVLVNTTARSWTVSPPDTRPGLPAAMDFGDGRGPLPEVFVAPVPPPETAPEPKPCEAAPTT